MQIRKERNVQPAFWCVVEIKLNFVMEQQHARQKSYEEEKTSRPKQREHELHAPLANVEMRRVATTIITCRDTLVIQVIKQGFIRYVWKQSSTICQKVS